LPDVKSKDHSRLAGTPAHHWRSPMPPTRRTRPAAGPFSCCSPSPSCSACRSGSPPAPRPPSSAASGTSTPEQAALLTTAVQIGFVAGTALAALLNLADLVPARVHFVAVRHRRRCQRCAARSVGLRGRPRRPLPHRLLPRRRLPARHEDGRHVVPRVRGLAIGVIVGALTVGKALPYLIGALRTLDYRFVVLSTSAGALLAAALVAAAYRDGPFPFPRGRSRWASSAPSCGTARRGSPSAVTSATCGSCTRCGLRSACSFRFLSAAPGSAIADSACSPASSPSRRSRPVARARYWPVRGPTASAARTSRPRRWR
jgi:hypothetical protein